MRSRISGFTLIELIITILVMAILLGIGVPSYMQFKEDNTLLGAAQALYSDIQFARSEAIKRDVDNIAVRIFSVDGAWCYRVSDNSSCVACDSSAASCDIHGDRILRGVSQADYPNVTVGATTVSSGTATIFIQARRATMQENTVTFTYGTSNKKINIETNLLGRVSLCTPASAAQLTGVDQCSG